MNVLEFDRKKYLENRKRDRLTFWILLIITIPVTIDIPYPPIPPRFNLMVLVPLVLLTVFFWDKGYGLRPLLKEVPRIARKHSGYLTIPLLALYLDIHIDQAATVIAQLQNMGLIKLVVQAENVGERVYKYAGMSIETMSSPDQTSPAASPADSDNLDRIRKLNQSLLDGTLNIDQSGTFVDRKQ